MSDYKFVPLTRAKSSKARNDVDRGILNLTKDACESC
jgi:hypothetical protein